MRSGMEWLKVMPGLGLFFLLLGIVLPPAVAAFHSPNSIVINGTQTYIIENCHLDMTVDIVVKDNATLIIRNATLTRQSEEIESDRWIFVEDRAKLMIEDAKIIWEYPSKYAGEVSEIRLIDNSSATLINISVRRVDIVDSSMAIIIKSSIIVVELNGSPTVTIQNSTIYEIFGYVHSVSNSVYIGQSEIDSFQLDILQAPLYLQPYQTVFNITVVETIIRSYRHECSASSNSFFRNTTLGYVYVLGNEKVYMLIKDSTVEELFTNGQSRIVVENSNFHTLSSTDGSNVTATASLVQNWLGAGEYSNVTVVNSLIKVVEAWSYSTVTLKDTRVYSLIVRDRATVVLIHSRAESMSFNNVTRGVGPFHIGVPIGTVLSRFKDFENRLVTLSGYVLRVEKDGLDVGFTIDDGTGRILIITGRGGIGVPDYLKGQWILVSGIFRSSRYGRVYIDNAQVLTFVDLGMILFCLTIITFGASVYTFKRPKKIRQWIDIRPPHVLLISFYSLSQGLFGLWLIFRGLMLLEIPWFQFFILVAIPLYILFKPKSFSNLKKPLAITLLIKLIPDMFFTFVLPVYLEILDPVYLELWPHELFLLVFFSWICIPINFILAYYLLSHRVKESVFPYRQHMKKLGESKF